MQDIHLLYQKEKYIIHRQQILFRVNRNAVTVTDETDRPAVLGFRRDVADDAHGLVKVEYRFPKGPWIATFTDAPNRLVGLDAIRLEVEESGDPARLVGVEQTEVDRLHSPAGLAIGGILNMGHAAFIGVGAYSSAIVTTKGGNPWIGMLVGADGERILSGNVGLLLKEPPAAEIKKN